MGRASERWRSGQSDAIGLGQVARMQGPSRAARHGLPDEHCGGIELGVDGCGSGCGCGCGLPEWVSMCMLCGCGGPRVRSRLDFSLGLSSSRAVLYVCTQYTRQYTSRCSAEGAVLGPPPASENLAKVPSDGRQSNLPGLGSPAALHASCQSMSRCQCPAALPTRAGWKVWARRSILHSDSSCKRAEHSLPHRR